ARPLASLNLQGLSRTHYFRDRFRQLRKLLRGNREGRCEIDDGAERTDESSLFHKTRAQSFEIVDLLDLNHANRAPHPHVLHASPPATSRHSKLHPTRNI